MEWLENAAGNVRDRLLIRLLSRIGCRISEALALSVDDIDFAVKTVTILHLKSRLKLSCPRCNARLSRSDSFCAACGAKVEEALVRDKEHRRLRTLHLGEDTLRMPRDYVSHGGPVTKDGRRLIFGINRHRAWQVVKTCAEKGRSV